MTREQKIVQLLKIAAGAAGPEALQPRRMAHRISAPNSGRENGLYVDGRFSTNPEDIKVFQREFAARRVKVVRK